jgi:hypothetical protein
LSATIFKSDKKQEQIVNTCPNCFNENNISLIPLIKDEVYLLLPLDPEMIREGVLLTSVVLRMRAKSSVNVAEIVESIAADSNQNDGE